MAADTHRAMWRLLTAFRVSRAIGLAVELGIPEFLARHPHTSAQLATDTRTHEPSLRRMLRLLVAIEILEEDATGRFALTSLGEELRGDRLGPLARLILADPDWSAWGRLDHSIKTGERAFDHIHGVRTWEFYSQHPEYAAIFDAAMQALTEPVAEAVAIGYDFSKIGTLADVGGGDGTMLLAILRHHPHLRGILFDQPHVVDRASPRFDEAGIKDRVELVGGSFFESVPPGADAFLMKSIIHDWEDDDAVAILRRCREAAGPGARLLLVERPLPERIGPDDVDTLLSDLNMLVNPGGRERTDAEYTDLFRRSGFELQRSIQVDAQFQILEATPSP